jgi:hypothetical protein
MRLPLQAALLISPIILLSTIQLHKFSWDRRNMLMVCFHLFYIIIAITLYAVFQSSRKSEAKIGDKHRKLFVGRTVRTVPRSYKSVRPCQKFVNTFEKFR